MPALTQPRNTPELMGRLRQAGLAAAVNVFAGALLMRQADGNVAPAAPGAGKVGCGLAQASVDNTAGAAGARRVELVAGTFRFANAAAADAVTAAEIGRLCYAHDDQTVGKTATGRSPAGIVEGLDELGVWVRVDEALTRALTA